jgi:catechol 2,3-dioxygenase-like lactoylglutathione lyase family enzyme
MQISHLMFNVRDQDEAKAFYLDKLGWELGDDLPFAEGGGLRWLTVHPPGQPNVRVGLMPVEAGTFSPEIKRRKAELLALSGLGGGIIFTDDCRRDFAELRDRGVEFSEEPEERFYGIDCGFRDPSGNSWRLTQPAAGITAA